MFSLLKKTFSAGLDKVKQLFAPSSSLTDEDLKKIQESLFFNNFSPLLVDQLIKKIKISGETPWKDVIKSFLLEKLHAIPAWTDNHYTTILLGINGSGKTTSSIKLARYYKEKGNKTLLVAADTFRAAAQQQLIDLAHQYKIDIFYDLTITDPSAVCFKSCEFAQKNNYESIVIDTAGRMHQKENLLKEIEKLQKVVKNKIGESNKAKTILVLDGLQGQSLIEQAKMFIQFVAIDGLIITKLDAGVKPGVIFTIIENLKVPVAYISYGEHETDLQLFDSKQFVDLVVD
jgi:fused signal recognition particle receptor